METESRVVGDSDWEERKGYEVSVSGDERSSGDEGFLWEFNDTRLFTLMMFRTKFCFIYATILLDR